MKFMILFFTLFSSLVALAVEEQFYPLGTESRYQLNQDQQNIFRNARAFSVGVMEGSWSALLERSEYNESYGNSTMSTEHRLTSYLMIFRWTLLEADKPGYPKTQILPSLGLGAHQDQVVNTLFGDSSKDLSNWETLTSLGLTLKLKIAKVGAELEVRASQGKLLDPTVAYGAVLRVGTAF